MKKQILVIPLLLVVLITACKKKEIENPVAGKSHGDNVLKLALEPSGRLWLFSSEHDPTIPWPLHMSSLPTRHFLSTHQNGNYNAVDNNYGPAIALSLDRSNNLWSLSGATISCRTGSTTKTIYTSPTTTNFLYLESDNNGMMWAGGHETGVVGVNLSGGQKIFTKTNSPIPSNKVQAIHVDNGNNLWVAFGDNMGVGRLTNNQWTIFNADNSPVKGQVTAITSVGTKTYMAMTADANKNNLALFDGTLWITYALTDEAGTSTANKKADFLKSSGQNLYIQYAPVYTAGGGMINSTLYRFEGSAALTKLTGFGENVYITDLAIDNTNKKIWLALGQKGLGSIALP